MKYEKGTFTIIPNKEVLRGKTPVLQTLFTWLCSYADEKGQCFPSRSTLASDIGVDIRTVDKYIEELISLGLIFKEKRKNRLKNLTNVYQIMIADGGRVLDSLPQVSSESNTLPSEPNTLPSESNTLGVANETTQRTHSNITHLSKLTLLNSDSSGTFDQFWRAYPNKELKKKSREIWESRKIGKFLPEILEFIKQAKETDRWQRGFIKQPPAFLNGECWEDDLSSYGKRIKTTLPVGATATKGQFINEKVRVINN